MKKRAFLCVVVLASIGTAWLLAQPAGDSLVDGFKTVEVASVSDAIEQLYGQRAYMSHEMRPLAATKFAGTAVTVQLKRRSTRKDPPRPRACSTRSMRRRQGRCT